MANICKFAIWSITLKSCYGAVRWAITSPQKVNLWYFCVERNAKKLDDEDDEDYDDEEEEDEEASSTESEQEENKVRSRRLPARR